jgi:hypothetical protein
MTNEEATRLCMAELNQIHREDQGVNIRSTQLTNLVRYLVSKGILKPWITTDDLDSRGYD